MVEWRSEGLVLRSTAHGEHDAVLDVLTRHHGRARGFVKAGNSRKRRAALQVGTRVDVLWRARLEDSLGRFSLEPVSSPLGDILDHPLRLSALGALSGTVLLATPEREPDHDLFEGVSGLLTLIQLDNPAGMAAGLARLDLRLLRSLGYGLDLEKCAVTGLSDELAFVSPKTGRAVSASAAGHFADRLLVLPRFLLDGSRPDLRDAVQALTLTNFFLDRQVWSVHRGGEPRARQRFLQMLRAQIEGRDPAGHLSPKK